MTLAAGTRLGPYEIVAPIGAGGMGEVYRARDTRLGREVAVKVLPSHVSDDPDLKARFEREARAISQLTHPHICTLHDVGNHDGVEYLVMELLEGQSLADRLEKGALPTEQVLRYGVEIADALDRAHRAGIIHRDLKPGNVMLTKSGVKLLDFGLAKVVADKAPSDMSSLPTQVSQPLTARGTIMGTFQYMAPEQLEGKEADARTDVFAFGCVLYEMATGKKAFSGASQASLVTAIMSKEPDPVSAVAPMTPPALDRVVQTCLAKDPEDRWQSAHDLKNELAWIARAGSQAGSPAPIAARRKNRERLAWTAAAGALVGAAGLAVVLLRRPAAPRAPTIRFDVESPAASRFGYGLALSPDGTQLVFEVAIGGVTKLYLRRLSSPSIQDLPGTEGGSFPFWSPDSTRIGFFAGGSLKRLDVATGSIQSLAPAVNGRGGTWSRDGVIVYAPDTTTELYRIPADGGAPAKVTHFDAKAGEGSHRWPVFLPDGKHFLFHIRYAGTGHRGIYLASLESDRKTLVADADSAPIFAPPGDLLYVRQKTLVDQPFDTRSFRAIGTPQPIVADVEALGEQLPTGYIRASASENGILAVRSGVTSSSRLTWFDRSGRKEREVGAAGEMDEPSLSPDATRVAYEKNDRATRQTDIWVLDLSRETETRLTFSPPSTGAATWSPDGRTIAYFRAPSSGTGFQIESTSASGNGVRRTLFHGEENAYPDAISPDGRTMLFEIQPSNGNIDLLAVPIDGSAKPVPYLATPFNEAHAQFSPDGKAVSYTSNESGSDEVYVRTFPSADVKWQVSTHGGDQAEWRADGKEIFYLSPDQQITAVPVERTPTGLAFGAPKALFAVHVPTFGAAFDRTGFQVSADGQRFLVNQVTGESERSPITVVVNWRSEAKK